jgi:hypothetical protein
MTVEGVIVHSQGKTGRDITTQQDIAKASTPSAREQPCWQRPQTCRNPRNNTGLRVQCRQPFPMQTWVASSRSCRDTYTITGRDKERALHRKQCRGVLTRKRQQLHLQDGTTEHAVETMALQSQTGSGMGQKSNSQLPWRSSLWQWPWQH